MHPLRRLLRREPALLFFAIGALLFVAYGVLEDRRREPITLSEAGLALLVSEFELLTGARAGDADRERLVQEYYTRELLLREGLRVGLHLSDPSIREAITGGMRQQIVGELPEPDAKALVDYYAGHIDRYYREATLSLEQVFFAALPEDVPGLLRGLNERGAMPAAGGAEAWPGDPPWQGRRFPDYGRSMLRGLFGDPLLTVMERIPLQRWEGPFESADGWHFFRVADRQPRQLMSFAAAKDQVRADYQAAVLAERVAAFVARRRADYPFERTP